MSISAISCTRKRHPCHNASHKNNVFNGTEEMNRTATTLPCPCHRPGSKAQLSQEWDIGLTDDGWDITGMICTRCGTPWLCAYFWEEQFPRVGRYFRVPVDVEQIEPLTASAALQLVESSELRLVGGSRYSSVECVDEGFRHWLVRSKQTSPALT
jgi:hypothetical protein